MGKTIIRDGSRDDLNAIMEMAEEFWQHTIYEDPFCPKTVRAMIDVCIDQGLMSVFEFDGKVEGFACGIKGALLGNASVATGSELAWWVNPDKRQYGGGLELVMHLENRARDAGIKYWNMIFMESSMPASVEKIYKKIGYNKVETIYSKVL